MLFLVKQTHAPETCPRDKGGSGGEDVEGEG